jgi:hypothetical protein
MVAQPTDVLWMVLARSRAMKVDPVVALRWE